MGVQIKDNMTIKDLEELMVKHGLVLRAIPYERSYKIEVGHKDQYPDGVVKYSEECKRDMLHITEGNGNLGGKFLIEQKSDRGSKIDFSLRGGKQAYCTIQEAINAIL